MFGEIFSGTVYGICALVMICIGVSDLLKKTPCGFYTGEEELTNDDITDVKAWNRKHGIMWILYGVMIMIAWVLGCLAGETLFSVAVYCLGVLAPIPIMIMYHKKLVEAYRVKKD